MMQERRRRRRREEAQVRFDPGAVFTPAEAKAEDLTLDLETARYKAQKGQAGNRGAAPG